MKKLLMLLSVAVFAGCQTSPQNEAEVKSLVPRDYRVKAVDFLHDYLRDPYSVMDAEISKPAAVYVGLGAGVNGSFGPGACIRYNAKNGFGGYVGRRTEVLWFSKTGVLLLPAMFGSCRDVEWTHFAELEAL